MPNSNIIDRIVGGATGGPQQGTKFAPAITLVTTTEKLVLDQTGNTALVYAMPTSAPSTNGPFDVFAFKVRATFKTTTGGSSTSVVNLYLGTSTSGTKIASVTSGSLATASGCGFLEATLLWDSTSTKVSGLQSGYYSGGSAVSAVALTTTTGTAATAASLVFCISATNGSSVTGTTFTLGEFVVEAL